MEEVNIWHYFLFLKETTFANKTQYMYCLCTCRVLFSKTSTSASQTINKHSTFLELPHSFCPYSQSLFHETCGLLRSVHILNSKLNRFLEFPSSAEDQSVYQRNNLGLYQPNEMGLGRASALPPAAFAGDQWRGLGLLRVLYQLVEHDS